MARGSARAEGCSSERAGVPLRLVSDPAEGRTSVAELVEGVGKGGRQGSAGGGGGGAPHHRLLATPPGAGLLTRRLLGPGPAQEGGGGGRLTTGFWRPPQAPGSSPGGYWGPGQHRRGGGGRLTTGFWRPPQAPGSSPGGYWGPGQRVREGLTTGFWPRVVRGGAPGGRPGWFPPGLAQLCMATGQLRLFLTGLMSVHGPGRMGEGPNSRPRRFLLAVPGGGGMRFRVFWEASYLPWQNPGGLFALGNLR